MAVSNYQAKNFHLWKQRSLFVVATLTVFIAAYFRDPLINAFSFYHPYKLLSDRNLAFSTQSNL